MDTSLMLYLLFWLVFVLVAYCLLRITAAALALAEEMLPEGFPPALRRLVWLLSIGWLVYNVLWGIEVSAPYLYGFMG